MFDDAHQFPHKTRSQGAVDNAVIDRQRHRHHGCDAERAVTTFEHLLASFNATDALADEIGTGALQRSTLEATLLNNVAAARLAHDGGETDPDRVYDYSRRAYELLPWQPAVESTWGTTLIFRRRPALGLAYLAAALSHEETPSNRAAILAYMALAHHHLGQTAEAETHLAMACALDADHHSLRQVRALLPYDTRLACPS